MKSQRGHGLVLALVVIFVMMTALGLLASSMRLGMKEVRREMGTVSLIALTDAAVAESLAHLADDDRFGGVEEYRFGRGSISSEVLRLGSGRVEVVARASYGGRQRELRVEVQLTAGQPRVLGVR